MSGTVPLAPERQRHPVHVVAASPRGAADPRQDGPPDLRLVGPALGGWLAAAVALGAPGAVAAGVCAVAASLAVLLIVTHRRGLPAAAATVLLCAAASAGVAALHAADLHRGPIPGLAARETRATVELTVTADPRLTRPQVRGAAGAPRSVLVAGDAARVTAKGTTTTVRTPVLVMAEPGAANAAWLRLLPSTRIRVEARLAEPSRPGDRIAAVAYVRGPPQVTGSPSATQRFAGDLRAGLRTATEHLPPDARALLPGLVVGDTFRIPPDLQEAFETTDLTHLLAVSGSNLTIILILLIGPAGLAIRAERGGLAPRLGIPLRLTAVLGGLLTLGFVIVCRPDPSVLRAAACGLVTLLAIGTGRRRALVPALAAAVLLLVLYDPWLARSYGFLLSVLATGALLTIAPRWSAALQRHRVPPRLAEALAAAGAAQAVCAPVVAVLAEHVSLVAIPCNLLAEFAVAPATILGFATLATAPFGLSAAKALAWLAGWPTGWIAAIARHGAALPGADVDWPGGWTGGLLLATLTGTAALLGRRLLRHPWLCAGLAVLLILAVVRPAPLLPRAVTGWPPPGWRFVMCDVGQGDALVLSAGDGTAVVVDAGPEPALVDRCLRSLDIRTVPLLILTHFHADHVAGLPGVLRGRTVGAIETTTLDEPPDQAGFVRRHAAAAHVPVIRAAAGERRRTGSLAWEVLWPPPRLLADDGPNDASVTLLVRTAGLRLLLLGDLEPSAQQRLLATAPGLPQVDVVKVAHHGSAYQDPALLAHLHPRLALVSTGRDNPYGHPSPRTITALRVTGATVLRTDTHGPIAVTGNRADLRTATGRPRDPP